MHVRRSGDDSEGECQAGLSLNALRNIRTGLCTGTALIHFI